MIRSHTRKAAVLLALTGIGLAVGAPFVLNAHAALAGLRDTSLCLLTVLMASALVSAMAKAGKLYLLQTALGFRVSLLRTFGITLAADFAFLASPLGAAGYGVNIGLLQRAGATWSLATTVVGADQALDLAFFGVAVPVSLLFAFGPLRQLLPHANGALALAILTAFALSICVAWLNRRRVLGSLDRTGRRVGWLNARREHWLGFCHSVRRQWLELLAMPKRRLAALLLLTTLQWMLRYGVLWLILGELGYRLPLGFVVAVQALALHAALWTGVPAGGGGADIALAAAFGNWVPRASLATALVQWRFATLYCPLLLGVAGFLALATKRGAALSATK